MVGLIAALPALWIVYALVDDRDSVHPGAWPAFAAGVLLCAGQSIHYTCLYLGVPWVVACFAVIARARPLRALALSAWFLAGVIVLLGVFEVVYRLVPGKKAYIDPVIFLFRQNAIHQAGFGFWLKVSVWMESFTTLMGLPMMLLVVAGAIVCFVPALRPRWLSDAAAYVLGLTGTMAIAYVILTPRSASIVKRLRCKSALRRLPRSPSHGSRNSHPARARTVLCFALAVVAFWTPAAESYANYQANQGLGRALHLAYAQPRFKSISLFTWFTRRPVNGLRALRTRRCARYTDAAHLARGSDDTWTVAGHAAAGAFSAHQCTDEAYLEGAGLNMFRHFNREPEMCEARVYDGTDIARQLSAPPLSVVRAAADFSYGGFAPAYTIGRTGGPSTNVGWMSGSGPTHYIDLEFAQPTRLEGITVVPPRLHRMGRPHRQPRGVGRRFGVGHARTPLLWIVAR